MRLTVNFVAAAAAIAAFVSAVSLPALAECQKYGFTVNDYGKEGPTKDAKSLLDKLIATKMTEKGIKDFHTGKKSVSCELFLNFIVFDEHTCTAEATVCWGGSALPKSDQTAAVDDAKKTKKSAEKTEHNAKKKDVAKNESTGEKRTTAALHRVPDPKKPVERAAAEAQPAAGGSTSAEGHAPTTEAAASESKSASAKPVETGSLSQAAKKAVKHHHAAHESSSTGEAASAKAAESGAGYPTPEPPQDGQ
jgi:hypothetical protein